VSIFWSFSSPRNPLEEALLVLIYDLTAVVSVSLICQCAGEATIARNLHSYGKIFPTNLSNRAVARMHERSHFVVNNNSFDSYWFI
jgi:hypothetical protein